MTAPPSWLVGLAQATRSAADPDPGDDRPRAAVLVLVSGGPAAGDGTRGGRGPRVLLTRRSQGLRTFPGAWTFPGGAAQRGDLDATATALREAQEETGLAPESVTVVGKLSPRAAGVYTLTPVLGWSNGPDLAEPPDSVEVSDLWWPAIGEVGRLVEWGARRMPDGSAQEIPPATRSILAELETASRGRRPQPGDSSSAT